MIVFSRSLGAAAIVLLAATPTLGQSDETCTAYREADAIYHTNLAVRDVLSLMGIYRDIGMAKVNSDKGMALARAINSLISSPSYRKAGEKRRRAYMTAYKGPVSADEHLMGVLLLADRRCCKDKIKGNCPGLILPSTRT